jgi:chromate transporter
MTESTQATPASSTPSTVHLFGAFLRLGVTAFGGPAMIAFMRKMAVAQKHWIDPESFQSGVALCQTIPGATVMQMAAYIGLRIRGVRGALAAYIGFCTPAFLLMMALSALYVYTGSLPAVVSVFSGLQAMIVAIVANATLSFGKTTLKTWKNGVIAVIAAGLFGVQANPVLILVLAAFLGVLVTNKQPGAPKAVPSVNEACNPIAFVFLLAASVAGFALLFFLHRELFDLALIMSRIDLMAFGGGFASVPLMFHEIVEVRSWMDGPTFLNGIALGQFTPGPIVITATFVGYLLKGPLGGLIATIAMFLPSFLILIGIAPWFDRLRRSPHFMRAIGGILCSFVGLLLTVTVNFGLNVHWDLLHILLAAAAFVALLLNVDLLWVVLLGAAVSLFAF